MKIVLRRLLRLTAISAFLTTLASPLAAPRVALGSPLPHSHPLCGSTTPVGTGLSYDADTQRCLIGGGGCAFYQ